MHPEMRTSIGRLPRAVAEGAARTGIQQPGCPGRQVVRLFKWHLPMQIVAIRTSRGFTLLEVLVVIALIAFLSVLAAPNLINWHHKARLRGAAENLKGDLEVARLRAIQESGTVSVVFSADRYRLFVDNNQDWTPDSPGSLLRDRVLPPGVNIDLDKTSFGSMNDKTRFFARGTTLNGSVILANRNGDQKKITVSELGRIIIESIKK